MQTTLGTAFYLILFDILRCWLNFVTPALRAYRTSHESSGISPFVAMFCRSPNNLVAHFETDETDDVDLNPLPVAKRDEISERLRERQEIVTKKMKRRWDTSNTIVCSPFALYLFPFVFNSLLSFTASFFNYIKGFSCWKQGTLFWSKTSQDLAKDFTQTRRPHLLYSRHRHKSSHLWKFHCS